MRRTTVSCFPSYFARTPLTVTKQFLYPLYALQDAVSLYSHPSVFSENLAQRAVVFQQFVLQKD